MQNIKVQKVNRATYQAEVTELMQELTAVLIQKNNDYSKPYDAFANFRTGEEWGVDVLKSIRLRMGDKIQRIDSFLGGAELELESAEDSYRDNIGYSILSIIALKNKEKQ